LFDETFGETARDALQIGMSPKHLPQTDTSGGRVVGLALLPEELPLTVRQAALYLGVSVQTVYLWVERKQIPHLRVMGRNVRFLKSDLEPFRAAFKQEVGNGKT
jgi:excisionase family DNA binding protein